MQGCSKSKETRGGDAIELKNKRGKGGCRGPEFQREQVWGGGSKKLKGGLKFKKGKCVGAQKTSGVSKLKKGTQNYKGKRGAQRLQRLE